MEKTREKSFLNIKSKLTAAIAMLLVAFFMVISSSYAWFTLSTAPEVTGIYTKVGANGNLEIALYTGTDITSGVGDTGKNETWGNIIDLSDDTYGLENITLLPSALYLTQSGTDGDSDAIYTVNQASPLLTPTYGSDGRVSALSANSIFGKYDGSVFKPAATSNEKLHGVKAIGTASLMTQQNIDYNNAISKINTALALAQNYASTSLYNSGSELASIAIKKGISSADSGYNISFVTKDGGMLATLTKSTEQLVIAMQNYYDAKIAVENSSLDADQYKAKKYVWTGENSADVLDMASNEDHDTAIYKFYMKYEAIKNAIHDAEIYITGGILSSGASVNAISDPANVSWTDVENVFIDSKLVVITDIKINGYSLDNVKDHIADLLNGIEAQLPANSGAYADIAELCGNYSTSITIDLSEATAGSSVAMTGTINAKMLTTVENAPTINLATSLTEPQWGEVSQSDMNITTFYGYAVDLAFRTNAASSDLMLQTTPTDRIYSDNDPTASETMGKGSTMTFTSSSNDFGNEQVAELMKAIRIVFTNETGEIIGVGALDVDNADVATGVTANIYLCEFETSGIASGDSESYTTIKLKKTKDDAGEEKIVFKSADADGKTRLMSLTQNEQTIITAYVYIDGNEVDNTMVANATSSMTGSLNLQFSSSAKLVPMNYSPLQNAGSDTTTTTEATTTATTVAP